MKKFIHIVIALLIVSLTFIEAIQNYMIVLIILQAINCVFLVIEIKKTEPLIQRDTSKKYRMLNSGFLIASFVLSILIFIFHKISSNLSDKLIEIIICSTFIYSILFTIVIGLSMDKNNRNKENILYYLVNALIIALICFSTISLKTDSYVNIINKQIEDLNNFMILAILGKIVVDFIVAFDINITF